jgi:hypothetical protein
MQGYLPNLLAELRGNFGDVSLAVAIIGAMLLLWWLLRIET